MAPPYTRNAIVLKSQGYHEEMNAGATGIIPGHLLQMQSDGTCVVHAVSGGKTECIFAKEDALQGKWFQDSYALAEPVSVVRCLPGDHVLGVLAIGAVAVTEGNYLVSAGDGTLANAPSSGAHTLYSNMADSTAVASTATETAFSTTYTMPASFLQAGDVVTVRGLVNSIGVTSTPTLRIRLELVDGASSPVTITVMDTSTVSVIASDLVEFAANIQIRTAGATGTMVANGIYTAGTPGTAVPTPWQKTSTTINTTVTQKFQVTATWSASSSSNTCKLGSFNVELSRINPQQAVAVALESQDNSAGSAVLRIAVRTL